MIKLKRKKAKKELEFLALCNTFQKNGVNSEAKALECKHNLKRNGVVQACIISAVIALFYFFLPKFASTALLFGIILLLFIISAIYRSHFHLQRYIDDVIKHPDFDSELGAIPDKPSNETDEQP